ncbi:MAG: hypothetical protein ACI4AH_00950 [Muribaculaceae bacterium]
MKTKHFASMLLWCVMAVLVSACAPKQSAEGAAEKTATPFELMAGMNVTSISVADSVYVAKCIITDEYMAQVFTDAEYLMVNVNSYSTKEPKLESLREAMRQDGMGIRIEAVDASGNAVNSVTMTAAEFCDAMPRGRVVNATVKAENAVCPMDMGGGASIVSVEAVGDDTVLYTVMCDDSYRSFDFISIEESMKGEIVNSIADAATKPERKEMGIYYKYMYVAGTDTLHTVTITPNDWMLY